MLAERPQRADARRNRERVLAAGREAFAEQGREAQMDDVARRAGVGVGTVYRHFPDKSALMEALLAERFEQFVALGLAALEVEDPWVALHDWLFACGELQASDMGFCDCLGDALPGERRAALAESTGLLALNVELLGRGQRAGVIRADADPTDIGLIMGGVAATARRQAEDRVGGSWRRHLALSLDGLRAPGSGPLPA
jgi:AcrR family transcriptional regulator